MDALPTAPKFRTDRGALGTAVRRLRPRAMLAVLACGLMLVGTTQAQEASLSPDQVFRMNPRTGKVETIPTVLSENSLSKVRGETLSGDAKQFDSSSVVEIVWGSAPTAFKDGLTYLKRGEHERAVAMFRSAATNSEAREVIQAAARYGAARALLAFGATDPNQYDDCVAECDRFLADYPSNRDVPRVRWLRARAMRLAGKGADAAQSFKALYEEGANDPPTEGYARAFCLRAGLEAAEAFLSAGDTLGARELYATLGNALQGLIASTDSTEKPLEAARLQADRGVAALGEGYCLLSEGQADDAVSFFESQRSNAPQGAIGRATLGLAEAYLAKGRHRDAQIQFARVSAVDYLSPDNRSRALLGLARSSTKVGDGNAADDAKRCLETIQTKYANTPAAREASELLKSL